jgi:hypothetical protein
MQDTNPAQAALVKLLAGPAGNLTVVGDDDQAVVVVFADMTPLGTCVGIRSRSGSGTPESMTAGSPGGSRRRGPGLLLLMPQRDSRPLDSARERR